MDTPNPTATHEVPETPSFNSFAGFPSATTNHHLTSSTAETSSIARMSQSMRMMIPLPVLIPSFTSSLPCSILPAQPLGYASSFE